MQLRDISFGSLRRRWLKGLFVSLALALGVGTLVAVVSLTRAARAEIGDELDRFGANIIVTPRSTVMDLVYGSVDLGGVAVDHEQLRTGDVATIRSIHHRRNLSAVAPKLIGTTGTGSDRVVLVGADMAQEPGVKQWWRIDGRWPSSHDEVLVGSELAHRLGVKPGDALAVAGRDLRVAGVIGPTGALDDHAVIADLAFAQEALGRPGELSAVEVSALCQGCPIEDIVSQIAGALPHARVMPIRQAVAARERAVDQMTRFAWIVSVLVLAAGALVVATTMTASVSERTREIGILRAVGFRQSHVARIVLLEAAVTSAAGGALGWGLGTAAAVLLGGPVADIATPVAADPSLAMAAFGLALGLGLVAAIYPAIRASRLDPAQAFREM